MKAMSTEVREWLDCIKIEIWPVQAHQTYLFNFTLPGQSVVADWKQNQNPETCTHTLSLVITTTQDRSTVNGC